MADFKALSLEDIERELEICNGKILEAARQAGLQAVIERRSLLESYKSIMEQQRIIAEKLASQELAAPMTAAGAIPPSAPAIATIKGTRPSPPATATGKDIPPVAPAIAKGKVTRPVPPATPTGKNTPLVAPAIATGKKNFFNETTKLAYDVLCANGAPMRLADIVIGIINLGWQSSGVARIDSARAYQALHGGEGRRFRHSGRMWEALPQHKLGNKN
jgi:hypothetical protein